MAENKQAPGPDEHAAPEIVDAAPAPELTAEEAVILEQEGQAALFEMGESLPDAPGTFDELPHEAPDHVVPFAAAAEKAAPMKEEKTEKPAPEAAMDKPKETEKAKTSAKGKTEKAEKPKEKKEQGATKPRKNRPGKVDKAVSDGAAPPLEDKMSRGESSAPGQKEAPAPEPEQPSAPRDATRAEKEEIVYLNLSELHAFKNHPFGVRDDAEMRSLVDSVKNGGVNQPAIVRPREDGGYEIIAGHRRQKASELAGYANMPCIVRNMTDDEAILAMTDDNLRQRSTILPSEKAQSLKMQVEAIKHQGARDASGKPDQKEIGKRSVEIVGEKNGINGKQVQRYVRLTELVPDLRKMIDEKKLAFTPAVEISYIKPRNQNLIAISIEGQQSSPSLSQAQRLRELDQKGLLNGDMIDGILCEEKKEVDKVIISAAELSNYFGKEKTPREMKDQILALLDEWKGKQPPELSKPEKKTDLEK